ncbi:hypothetical protein E8E13_010263 [Curvularia kusanoi]|uniref:Uncharacterized protein n=1 Tax=Curvularia kusanoi TaxID=90978 RepID=A0A9P4WCN7_CURKU|nr:hypothetical protein E8E13_010263 [Curvularia kusanoi]
MAALRPYVPSMALIRALSRPRPFRCALSRPLPAQFVRGKKSKAAQAREAEKARLAQKARRERYVAATAAQREADVAKQALQHDKTKSNKQQPLAPQQSQVDSDIERFLASMQDPAQVEKWDQPVIIKDGEKSPINRYEEDPDTGERRLVPLGNEAEQRWGHETRAMIKESYQNSDFDDAELNRRMMDLLIKDPAFASLAEDLKEIKEDFMSKEEQQRLEAEAATEEQPAIDEMNEALRTTISESITELINDPDVGEEKADLQAVLDKLSTLEDFEDPEFQALMDTATEKVNHNPKLREKLSAINENETPEEKAEREEMEKFLEEMTTEEQEVENEEDDDEEISEKEINELMQEMRGMLKEISQGGGLDKDLEKMLSAGGEDAEKDAASRAEDVAELKRLAERLGVSDPQPEEDQEALPPALAAQVDKLMADPRLMEKLSYIEKLIEDSTAKSDPNDLTQIDAELAPDPYEMDDARTATLEQRMASARADPEHSAALRLLRVKLQPPYNISPALKSFNQAIEFAYIGANDDVRRVLWRSYQKARVLPTFLQSLSDDAWDILYYSQAVTWTGNQNRTDHLKELLKDLAAVGRTGPPTHPSELGQHQEAARLEAAQREQSQA